jgi:hypothetical protein
MVSLSIRISVGVRKHGATHLPRCRRGKVLASYTYVQRLGQPVTAFVWVRTSGMKCRETGPVLMGLSCNGATVEECHSVIGEWVLLLKVRADSPSTLQDLIDEIREAPGQHATLPGSVPLRGRLHRSSGRCSSGSMVIQTAA